MGFQYATHPDGIYCEGGDPAKIFDVRDQDGGEAISNNYDRDVHYWVIVRAIEEGRIRTRLDVHGS